LEITDFKHELLTTLMTCQISFVYRQDTSSKISVIVGRRKRFAKLIIKSFDDFMEIYKKLTTSSFNRNARIIIILIKAR
jgi:hypothetical protein